MIRTFMASCLCCASMTAGMALVLLGFSPSARGQPFLVRFVERAAEAGLTAALVHGHDVEKTHIVETLGSGVAFLDYDNDGWLDVFLVNGSRLEGFAAGQAPSNHFYRNNRDGTFTDVTHQANLRRSGWGAGICTGDIDNDGFDDIYVTYWGTNVLYRNNRDGSFTDVTARSGVGGPVAEVSTGCTFLDYDRDGYLDLFVASYGVVADPLEGIDEECDWLGLRGRIYCYAALQRSKSQVTLYRNRGDGTFQDVSQSARIGRSEPCLAFTAVAADLDGDGWTDVYVACDASASIFLRNNGDGTFADRGVEAGVALSEYGYPQAGMGADVGDYDNDGHLDLIKTNFSRDLPNLYRQFRPGWFEDAVSRAGLWASSLYVGWGVGFVDLDNDGWKDIFQVNGHLYPALEPLRLDEGYRQPRLVYRNGGNGRFEEVSEQAGLGVGVRKSSRGAAFGDFDSDGDIDILVMNMGEPPSLLRNDGGNGGQWIRLKLEGTTSNRSAIGATAVIEAGGLRQTGVVVSQSSFLSQSDRRLHFGLGGADRVDKITVRWPNGLVEQFSGGRANGEVHLVEGSGVPLADQACPWRIK